MLRVAAKKISWTLGHGPNGPGPPGPGERGEYYAHEKVGAPEGPRQKSRVGLLEEGNLC